MTHIAFRTCFIVPIFLLAVSGAAEGEARKTPKSTILCLPPGGTKPMPCAAAVAGSTIGLTMESVASSEPFTLVFTEMATSGRKPVVARVAVSPTSRRGNGAYFVAVPRQLCTKESQDKLGNFEIQRIMFNQSGAEALTLGTLAITC